MDAEALRLLSEGAKFYVCGHASTAREVGKRVGEAMGRKNSWGEQEVKEWGEGELAGGCIGLRQTYNCVGFLELGV